MTDKIINTFQQRRQLEQAITDFAQTQTETELASAARHIVHTYPADLVLTLLLKHLDTGDSQVRGGLGHLAALLPPEEIATALRTFVANRQHSAAARVTAALIAERFLSLELPSALMSDLHNSDEIAFQSLREALAVGQRDRHVLLEYVTQMQQLGEEIALMVLNLLGRVPASDQIEILRLIAQDHRPHIGKEAVTRLEHLTSSEAEQAAMRALHTLQFTLPHDLSTQIERALRKLRFSGKRYAQPSSEQWRALLSPADVNGTQSIWLLKMPATPTTTGVLLGFVFNLGQGIVHFFGSEMMERSVLPDLQTIGSLVPVATDDGGTAVLLEVPFDYGRWLLAKALEFHRSGKAQPLTGEYTLYNDLMWQFDAPQVDEQVQLFFQANANAKFVDGETLDRYATTLLAHPIMEEWKLQNRSLLQATRPNASVAATLPATGVVAMLLHELEKWPENRVLVNALEIGLRAQASWLYYRGESESAEQAHILADQMQHLPLSQNPLLARMLADGVQERE
ncbi:MAG: hypothetical protein NT075_10255 [Chloroflexi bacterium]|nr:hypothetical protein [Chloroflexota bacterium]